MSANYVIIQGFFYFSFISTSLFFPWKKQISIYQQNLVQALFYFYFFQFPFKAIILMKIWPLFPEYIVKKSLFHLNY